MDHISEGSDSDEDYNLKNFGIYQALPVEGEPDWSVGTLVLLSAAKRSLGSGRQPLSAPAFSKACKL
jgi:hypothetical protein